MEQKTIKIKEKILKCLYCGNDEFIVHDTVLNKSWTAIMGMEIFGNQGKAYLCKNCGYKHEFYLSK